MDCIERVDFARRLKAFAIKHRGRLAFCGTTETHQFRLEWPDSQTRYLSYTAETKASVMTQIQQLLEQLTGETIPPTTIRTAVTRDINVTCPLF